MWFDRLVQGAIDTLLMVGVSSLIALLVGIPLAVFLVTSDKGGIYQAPALNRVLGAFVNLFRSIPFLILMVALIPFTRLIVGTTYGVWAAVVPLTIAATPFFARIAEVSLREVDHGLIEAAQAMGLPPLAHHLACAVARGAARHRRRLHHHPGDHDQLIGHGRGDRCRWPGRYCLPLRLPALRYADHAHGDCAAGGAGGGDPTKRGPLGAGVEQALSTRSYLSTMTVVDHVLCISNQTVNVSPRTD